VTATPGEQVVLVSSAEFVLKSSHVRRSLEQRLIDDLRFALRNSNIQDFTIDKVASRIIVGKINDAPFAARVIARIFGVAYAVPAIRVESSMKSVLYAVRQRAAETLTFGQSFAIRCHGSARSPISSRDVEREAGSQILKTLADRKIRVNLDQPDVLISVDLSGENTYLYTTRIPGPGGLPLSSQWKMLGILESPLSLCAAYVMMRRGCITQLLIPCSATDMRFQTDRQIALARKLREFVTRENYPGFILELDKIAQSTNLIRRIGLEFAREHRFRGVVLADVGGSIVFDSSILRRSRELGLPIFQPLIGLDETDISKLGQLLGVDWRNFGDTHDQPTLIDNLNLSNPPITEISL